MCVRRLQENGECAAGAARAQSSDGANEPRNSKYEKPPSWHKGESLLLKTESEKPEQSARCIMLGGILIVILYKFVVVLSIVLFLCVENKTHRRQCKCRHLKKLTCKGTLRQVFKCLRPKTPYINFCHQIKMTWHVSTYIIFPNENCFTIKVGKS